jgi:hypothetical protein
LILKGNTRLKLEINFQQKQLKQNFNIQSPLGHTYVPSMFQYNSVLIHSAFKCIFSGDHSQVTRRKHGEDTEKT